MKKKILSLALVFMMLAPTALAQTTYTVLSGDSMWKIAVKYQVGVSEIIQANPQVKNPSMIYPGQKLTIPTNNDIKALENEVIRLTNIERSKNGIRHWLRTGNYQGWQGINQQIWQTRVTLHINPQHMDHHLQ